MYMLLQDSLSARVLVVALLVTVLVTSLISIPLIGHYSISWLQERGGAAYLAAIVLESSPNGLVDAGVQKRLLGQAEVLGITVGKADGSTLMLGADMPLVHDLTYDLREAGIHSVLGLLFQTLVKPGKKIIHVTAEPQGESTDRVWFDVSCNGLLTQAAQNTKRAIGTALFTALLVSIFFYGFLQVYVVRPLQRLTRSIFDFRKAPEDATRIAVPSGRADEIGIAEGAFLRMQTELRDMLLVRAHLAAIGSAVTKIQHDLRGLLSSAMVMSDTLEESPDPAVQRIAVSLVAAIERAANLCRNSINYARKGALNLDFHTFDLCVLVEEVFRGFLAEQPCVLKNQVPAGFQVTADRIHLYRVFTNLLRNALEAGAGQVTVGAWKDGEMLVVDVTDDGRGIPAAAVGHLFKPFVSSNKMGGSGLGLAIAREILLAHGGEIGLVSSVPGRTVFRIRLPFSSKG